MMRTRVCGLFVLIAAVASANEPVLPPPLAALLDDGAFVDTPEPFRMLALSFVADGCAAMKARGCVERAYQQAVVLRRKVPRRAEDGLWLTHYALILGAADRVGPCLDPAEHRRISELLGRRSLADRTSHVASYATSPLRWPADQAATLAALARHDRAHGTALVAAPLAAWRRYIEARAFDAKLGLPRSEATGRAPYAKRPRGCALTYETIYLHEVDDALAQAWWANVKRHYLVRSGLVVGVREWPPGIDAPSDADSGPIVAGVGAAATAFGLPAARVLGDEVLARELAATAERGELLTQVMPALGRAARSTLAAAVRFLGAHARP